MKKTVCIDFDGTLAKYTKWKGEHHLGEPCEGAKEFMECLAEKYHVVIYTTRTNIEVQDRTMSQAEIVQLLANWLGKHDIPYDEIFTGCGKPLCAAFIDDRAVTIRTNPNSEEYINALKRLENVING